MRYHVTEQSAGWCRARAAQHLTEAGHERRRAALLLAADPNGTARRFGAPRVLAAAHLHILSAAEYRALAHEGE